MPHYVLRVNPTHHRRVRRVRRRRNPTAAPRKPLIDTPVIVVAAITGGLALFLLSRPSGAQPVPLPSPGTPSSPSPSPGATLDSRLQSSEQAREIWIFQAILYMYAYSTMPPDGIDGPITQDLIRRVNADTNSVTFTTGWEPDMVRRARLAIDERNTPVAIPRANIPSQSVMALIEQTSQHVDPGTTFNWA